jgi:arabinan endo-1,5-alpha-L-arabinosidase
LHALLSGCLLVSAGLCLSCSSAPDVVAVRQPAPLAPELLSLTGDLTLSDPSAIYVDQQYWVFSSGGALPIHSSTDLRDFQLVGNAFEELPAWVAAEVPDATSFWSPEIASFGGRYHLYYAVSTTGSSRSCIGHASAAALGTEDAWLDEGALICTMEGDDWNAIDPTVLVDDDGLIWLALGSYRTGLKLLALDEASGRRSGSALIPLAERPGMGMIQAAELTRHGAFYYLFASFDDCCPGATSTHHIMVGRATDVRGPYLDRTGTDLRKGGGTLVLESSERWRGPGSNDVLTVGAQSYNLYRAYDLKKDARAMLRISTLVWDELGWPASAGP